MENSITPFSRTLRSLAGDRTWLPALTIVATCSLLFLWFLWFLGSRVPLFLISETAQISSDASFLPVVVEHPGRVAEVRVEIDQEVAAGEVLLRLEDGLLDIELREVGERIRSLEAELRSLRASLASDEGALGNRRQELRSAVLEARQTLRSARADLAFAREEVGRYEELAAEGLASRAELSLARAAEEKAAAREESAREAIERLEREEDRVIGGERSGLQRFEASLEALEGELSSARAEREMQRQRRDELEVRSPLAGRVATLDDRLRPGVRVLEGQEVATILAGGELEVVATFSGAALGRLQPGQPGRLRLDAFPWTEFGTVEVVVERVARDLRQGTVDVRCAVVPSEAGRAPLRHGLAGQLVVEYEEVSPLALLLRSLGRRLTSDGPASEPTGESP